jgi:hypothetical protein
MLCDVRAKYRRMRTAEVRAVAPHVKSLGSVARNQAAAVSSLNEQLTALAKGLGADTCSCGGACVVCRLDRAKPVVAEIFRLDHRVSELHRRLDYAGQLRRVGTGLWELTGQTKHLCGDLGERELNAELAEKVALRDRLLDQLCHPAYGLNPSHELCKGYACDAR